MKYGWSFWTLLTRIFRRTKSDYQLAVVKDRFRVERSVRTAIMRAFESYDCVVLLGPRRIGKSDLAGLISTTRANSIYIDVEKEDDLVAKAFGIFQAHPDYLIVLDEVQIEPRLFGKIRAYLDERRRTGSQSAQFLLLGSASLDLIQRAAHRLSGRFQQVLMSGFDIDEVRSIRAKPETPALIAEGDAISDIEELPPRNQSDAEQQMGRLWLRGGLPESFLGESDALSLNYRDNFLRQYFDLDIPNFGFEVDGLILERVFRLVADDPKGILNTQTFSNRLGCDGRTVGQCLFALQRLLLIREIRPWTESIRGEVDDRRQFYIRDSGLAHAVARIQSFDQLSQWPKVGESWEAFAAEQLIVALEARLKVFRVGYFRTKDGSYEIDLVLQVGSGPVWGIEMKKSPTARLSRKNADACDSVHADRRLMVHSGSAAFNTSYGFEACSLSEAVSRVLNE